MSAEQQQVQLLDPDTAYGVVHQKVYAPVFFEKVAQDFGLVFNTPAEQYEALTMASQLRQAHDAEQAQAQQGGGSMLKEAHAHLNGVLASNGFATPAEAGLDDTQIKTAAANASFDPELAHAVLSLQAGAGQAQAAQAQA